MKLKCRCGHDLPVWADTDQDQVRCPYCGRAYNLVDDGTGRLVATRARSDAPGSRRRAAMEASKDAVGGVVFGAATRTGTGTRSGHSRPRKRRKRKPEPEPEVAAEAMPWTHYLRAAWRYPLQAGAKYFVLAWGVVYALLPRLVPDAVADIVYDVLLVFMFTVLAFYEFELLGQSAWDCEGKPERPDFSDFVDGVLNPICQLFMLTVVSMVPFYVAYTPVRCIEGLPQWWSLVVWVGVGLSLALLPIHALAVAAFEDVWALDPRTTLGGVRHIWKPYLAFCLLFGALGVAGAYGAMHLDQVVPSEFGPRLVKALVGTYLLTVAVRALGALSYVYSDRMGWTRSVD